MLIMLFSIHISKANRYCLDGKVGALIGFTGHASPHHDSSTGTGAFLPKDAASEGNSQDCKRQRAGARVVIMKT